MMQTTIVRRHLRKGRPTREHLKLVRRLAEFDAQPLRCEECGKVLPRRKGRGRQARLCPDCAADRQSGEKTEWSRQYAEKMENETVERTRASDTSPDDFNRLILPPLPLSYQKSLQRSYARQMRAFNKRPKAPKELHLRNVIVVEVPENGALGEASRIPERLQALLKKRGFEVFLGKPSRQRKRTVRIQQL